MTDKQDDFVPYGPEWEKEMMKWNKPMLIDYLRKLLNDPLRAELITALEQVVDNVESIDYYNGVSMATLEICKNLISKSKAQ